MFGNLNDKKFIIHFSILIKFFFVLCVSPMEIESSNKHRLIVNFVEPMNFFEWIVVNDNVMGVSLVRELVLIQTDTCYLMEMSLWSMVVALLLLDRLIKIGE